MKKKVAVAFATCFSTVAIGASVLASSVLLTSCQATASGLVTLNAGLNSVSDVTMSQFSSLYDNLAATPKATDASDANSPAITLEAIQNEANTDSFKTAFVQAAVDAINQDPNNLPVLNEGQLSPSDVLKVNFDIWTDDYQNFKVVSHLQFNNNFSLVQPASTSSFAIESLNTICTQPVTIEKALEDPNQADQVNNEINVNGGLSYICTFNRNFFPKVYTYIAQQKQKAHPDVQPVVVTMDDMQTVTSSQAFQERYKLMIVSSLKINGRNNPKLNDSDISAADIQQIDFSFTTNDGEQNVKNPSWTVGCTIHFADRITVSAVKPQINPSNDYYSVVGPHTAQIIDATLTGKLSTK